MIESEKQYQVTKKQAEMFDAAIGAILEDKTLNRVEKRVKLDALTEQYHELVEQLEAWEGQSK